MITRQQKIPPYNHYDFTQEKRKISVFHHYLCRKKHNMEVYYLNFPIRF